jgi:hypothetical protein
LKIPNTKQVGGVAQGIGPEFRPQYHKTNKQNTIVFTEACQIEEEKQYNFNN